MKSYLYLAFLICPIQSRIPQSFEHQQYCASKPKPLSTAAHFTSIQLSPRVIAKDFCFRNESVGSVDWPHGHLCQGSGWFTLVGVRQFGTRTLFFVQRILLWSLVFKVVRLRTFVHNCRQWGFSVGREDFLRTCGLSEDFLSYLRVTRSFEIFSKTFVLFFVSFDWFFGMGAFF